MTTSAPVDVAAAEIVADRRELDDDTWLDLRRGGIGGSDAAAICGQDRWRSAFEVWLEKTAAPNLPDDDASEAAEWGTILEPVVRAKVAEREALTIVEHPFVLRSTTHDFMLANVDGVAVDDHGAITGRARHGVYEGKTASIYLADEWADDKVPDAYLLQGMHYLAVTGLEWLVFGVLIGGQQLAVRYVERDQELIDHLVAIEAEFWQRVLDRRPPEPDGSKACTELLAHLYDVKPNSVLTVDDVDHVRYLLGTRAEKKALAKAFEAEADECENRLKVLLGDHEVAVGPDGKTLFTWRQHERRSLDTKALQHAHPDLVDAFTRTSTYRRFHVPKGVL